jgi:hypothetical protein
LGKTATLEKKRKGFICLISKVGFIKQLKNWPEDKGKADGMISFSLGPWVGGKSTNSRSTTNLRVV